MPPLPSENNPSMVGEGGSKGGVTRVGGPSTVVILPGVSVGEPRLQHLEFVPHIVPWST
jgi:hypothetical protein